jgi:hypothetical protein
VGIADADGMMQCWKSGIMGYDIEILLMGYGDVARMKA